MSSIFVTLQAAIHAIARVAVREITQAAAQGQTEAPFTVQEIREAVRGLSAEQRTVLCQCQVGIRGIQFLLADILWEDFGLTLGRRHGGIITVRGARQGTLAAELRQQLGEGRH
jgi:hypothetical protein